MFSLKKLFFNFQCPICPLSCDVFAHEIVLYFEFPIYALSFDFFTPEIILCSFKWLLRSIRRTNKDLLRIVSEKWSILFFLISNNRKTWARIPS